MEKIKEIVLKLFKLESLAQNLTGYVEARLELFKLEIRTDLVKAISRAMVLIFLALLGFLFLLFLSLGIAYLINRILDTQYIGFFVVSIVYGLLFLYLYLNRKSVELNLENQLLKKQKINNR